MPRAIATSVDVGPVSALEIGDLKARGGCYDLRVSRRDRAVVESKLRVLAGSDRHRSRTDRDLGAGVRTVDHAQARAPAAGRRRDLMGLSFVHMSRTSRALRFGNTLFAALLFLIGSVTARAQEADEPQARAEFERGMALLDAGHAAEAVTAFEASLARLERAATMFNLVVALVEAGRRAEAATMIERYLILPSATAQRKAALRERLVDLRGELARVRVTDPPRDAAITLDGGRAIALGTPQTPFYLEPGTHRLELMRVDEEPVTITFEARRGETVAVDLAVASAPEVAETPAPGGGRVALWPWATMTGAVAVAAMVGAIVTGAVAADLWGDARNRCPDFRCPDPRDVTLAEDAGALADASTGLWIGAGALATASVVLWIVELAR